MGKRKGERQVGTGRDEEMNGEGGGRRKEGCWERVAERWCGGKVRGKRSGRWKSGEIERCEWMRGRGVGWGIGCIWSGNRLRRQMGGEMGKVWKNGRKGLV